MTRARSSVTSEASAELRRRALRSQSGQATIEFGGMIVWLLLAALFCWQLALVGWTYVSANNAARTAARTASRGGNGQSAGRNSLSGSLQGDATVTMSGDSATVHVPIPIVIPGLQISGLAVTTHADMPPTG